MAAVNAGAIAFSRAGDPKTGKFEPAEVLKSFSADAPAEDAMMDRNRTGGMRWLY
jgi:hypothetical protein